MKALFYLKRTIFINRLKKTVKKPLAWIGTVFIVGYLAMILFGWAQLLESFQIDNVHKFATVIMVAQLYLGVPTVLGYLKRKGILFKSEEVQLVFPTPENPKLFLLFAGLKSALTLDILLIVVGALGVASFKAEGAGFLFYVGAYILLSFFVETSLIVLLYGNETLSEKTLNIIKWAGYAVLAFVAVWFLALVLRDGFRFELLTDFMTHPAIKMIPLFGWAIALMQLFVFGVTWSNVLGSLLYLIAAVLLSILAYRSKCTGAYFEDAEKFSKDYAEAMQKSKKGQIAWVGGKTKYRSARVEYKGNYARAIYYRQLLEYRKNRFFIFGFRTLLFFALGIAAVVVEQMFGTGTEIRNELGEASFLIIPGVMAYVLLLSSNYRGKWGTDLENAYTYMLPDSNIRKAWNATLIAHVVAIIDSALLTVPAAYALKLSPVYIVLIILSGVLMNALHIYYHMAFELLLEAKMGVMKPLLQFLEVIIIFAMFAICVGAGIGGYFIFESIEVAVVVFLVLMALLSGVGLALTSLAFDKMELEDE